MAEEIKSQAPAQNTPPAGNGVKGDFSTILVGVGTLIDNTISPLSKIVVQALESVNDVAQQILDGVSKSLDSNKSGN